MQAVGSGESLSTALLSDKITFLLMRQFSSSAFREEEEK